MRVLIVDDDPIVRKLLIRQLGTEKSKCVEASNHAEAMQHVGLEEFDLALVDVNLGSDDGIDLAVLLRTMNRLMKVIVMSADPGNEQRVRDAGFGDMLPKPFTLDELNQRLG